MVPIYDRNPVRRTPVVTYALIAVNIVVFLLSPVAAPPGVATSQAAQLCSQERFFREYAAIPKELMTNEQLRTPVPTGQVARDPRSGGVGCLASPPDFRKSPALSVLFAMFLHGGWLHLLGNMLFLFVFGNNVEDRLGRLRYLLFYLVCGYIAAYGFAAYAPDSTTTLVGASGAIAGVLGAYLVLFPRAWVLTLIAIIPVPLPAWLVLGWWFFVQWVYTQGTGMVAGSEVAYLAHVIGFLVGLVLVLPLVRRRGSGPPRPTPPWRAYR